MRPSSSKADWGDEADDAWGPEAPGPEATVPPSWPEASTHAAGLDDAESRGNEVDEAEHGAGVPDLERESSEASRRL